MIEVINVTKKYGKTLAIDNISFEIKDNEIVGFLGPNGAGKTTTMNMLTGYIEPTYGQILINGLDVVKKARKAKKQIGYMPENVPVYTDFTVREFINYMAELKEIKSKDRKKSIEEIIKEVRTYWGRRKTNKKLIKRI